MENSNFVETKHTLIESLLSSDDTELLSFCQQYLDQGKYLVAIFCRNATLVRTLIEHSIIDQSQINKIFTIIWQSIFPQLFTLKLDINNSSPEFQSLSNWLIYITTLKITDEELLLNIPDNQINVSVENLPLDFYVEKALDQLTPLHRLVFLLKEKFNYSEPQIIDYLLKEGEIINFEDLPLYLEEAYHSLIGHLPEDICLIYDI